LEAWEKVYVEDAEFLSSIHNLQSCIGCHGGVDGELGKELAHEGVVRDPTSDPEKACASCHSTEVEMASTGLHGNLTGYYTALEMRGADFSNSHMQEAFNNHCGTCHASCGQCHVSRPTFTEGGLIAGHRIKEHASMTDTCMACHGARVANEYKGLNEGVPGSVHWLQGGMSCYDCHDISEFHGEGPEARDTHRYDGPPSPDCVDCHPEVTPDQSDLLEHDIHWNKVSCDVCHVSGTYKNCFNCHVALDEQGLPYYETDDSQMMFKIGHNPNQSEDRPWEYVLVRHVPVEPDTFVFYDDALLMDFGDVPTWKYATPHNIQRVTPQNATCNSCHGNAELFLTKEDVPAGRWETNASVIVASAPPATELELPEQVEMVHDCVSDPSAATHVLPESCQPQLCTTCHPQALAGDWSLLNDNMHTLYTLVEPKGDAIACEDCHSPEGGFDWAAAGYGAAEAADFIWDDFPGFREVEDPSSGPLWMLWVAAGVIVAAGAPFVVRRRNQREES
jgi:hypothetical protein